MESAIAKKYVPVYMFIDVHRSSLNVNHYFGMYPRALIWDPLPTELVGHSPSYAKAPKAHLIL
jgi:hypothetical protein